MAAIPGVAAARVEVAWPAQVTVVVEERVPQVLLREGGQTWWVDAQGREFKARGDLPGLLPIESQDGQPLDGLPPEAVLKRVRANQIFISVAAVADYRPARVAEHKLKKGSETFSISLEPNPDILAEVAAMSEPPFCVGFAAESQNLEAYAEGKRRAKRLPLLVGNLVQDGLGGDENQVILFEDAGQTPLPRAPKLELARRIVGHVAAMLSRG